MNDPEIVDLSPQPTAAIRISQPMADLDLAAAFDRGMPLVASRIAETGGSMGGPPFGRYHQFGPDVVDVEIGFRSPTHPICRRSRRSRAARSAGPSCPVGRSRKSSTAVPTTD